MQIMIRLSVFCDGAWLNVISASQEPAASTYRVEE
jgi:hypothetical protein